MSQTTENYDPDQYNWRDFIDRFPCTAHITAWHNQQYHAKSKVMIPSDATYNKSTLKMFQNLKNKLTHESLVDDQKVEVEYQMYDNSRISYKSENRHTVTIVITKDWVAREKADFPEYIKNEQDQGQKHYNEQHHLGNRKASVYTWQIDGILENLPKGYHLSGIDFESNNFDGGYGLQNNAITRIHFEKFVARKRVY
tara:strand:- start:730 stop:1320 length:591 start_codon:yes stop_codon:yes gene_type:complete